MVHYEGATGAAIVPLRADHEVVDDELASAFWSVGLGKSLVRLQLRCNEARIAAIEPLIQCLKFFVSLWGSPDRFSTAKTVPEPYPIVIVMSGLTSSEKQIPRNCWKN